MSISDNNLFVAEKHISYLLSTEARLREEGSFEGFLATSLQMGGCYWTVTGLLALDALPASREAEVIDFIASCASEDGYGQSPGFDAHVTSTHYAVLVLKQLGRLDLVDVDSVSRFLGKLQNPDGSIKGDLSASEESDLRFAYNAVAIHKILALSADILDINKLHKYITNCKDAQTCAFAPIPGAEPHAAYTYCAVAALAILGKLPCDDRLTFWLAERQTSKGGFNGRPEKEPDVCYSWWILATMEILEISDCIDCERLRRFVVDAQDLDDGGISDRPGCAADVFHTFFGIASLALLGVSGVKRVDPVFAIVL